MVTNGDWRLLPRVPFLVWMARDEGGLIGIGRNGALQGFLSPRQGFWRSVHPYIRTSVPLQDAAVGTDCGTGSWGQKRVTAGGKELKRTSVHPCLLWSSGRKMAAERLNRTEAEGAEEEAQTRWRWQITVVWRRRYRHAQAQPQRRDAPQSGGPQPKTCTHELHELSLILQKETKATKRGQMTGSCRNKIMDSSTAREFRRRLATMGAKR